VTGPFSIGFEETGVDDPKQLGEAAAKEIAAASSSEALEQVRVKHLGRNGAVTQMMRGLGNLPAEERRTASNSTRSRTGSAPRSRRAPRNWAAPRSTGALPKSAPM
jgi:phenylalanyl-tRNA synthetase alpha chain